MSSHVLSAWARAMLCLGPALMLPWNAISQGCVSAPGNPMCSLLPGDLEHSLSQANTWTASFTYRYFESFRHFVGDEEQPERIEIGNNVINTVHSWDLALTYGINSRWSVSAAVPFFYAERTSWYEHTRTNRHSMDAGGLRDVRFTTDYWLRNPDEHPAGNIALGIGFEAPTGDDHATDIAYRQTGEVRRPVDPSIQPGDGGWGVLLQIQGYQRLFPNAFAYLQGNYLLTPEEQNDTETPLGDSPTTAPNRKYGSIADQYFGRVGMSYTFWPEQGLTLSFGGRIEGIPAYDAVGDSMGFRRPGYTISVEPSIAWSFGRNVLAVYAPVAVYRNRERSAPEVALHRPRGDAAFADYSIIASFSRRL